MLQLRIEPGRLALAAAGFVPVSLIGVAAFGVFGLRDLATHVLAAAAVLVAVLVSRSGDARRLVVVAVATGVLATATYDVVRFGFLWTGLMDRDPIPHIGTALHLKPAWVFGYLWRYLGNGSGLALAFLALGLRGVRQGVLFGLVVCAGLLATLIVTPYGQEMLFPLTLPTVVMALVGHVVYGAVLGALAPQSAAREAASGYKCSRLPGLMRAPSMNASSSSAFSLMTRPIL